MSVDDGILDPAHDPDSGVENVGVAGIAKPEQKDTPDEFKVSDDGNVAEHKGLKYVRQEALHQERQERQKLADTLRQLDPVMPEFEEFLKQRNGRQESTVDRARQSARGGADKAYTDDELEGFAITRGYYGQDGTTPDLNRAQKELDIISGISRRQAREEVAPVTRSTTQERARLNREKARAATFVDGQPIASQQYIDAALQSLDDTMMADPNVANIAQIIAVGLETLDQRKNGTARRSGGQRSSREPMMVERPGGRPDDGDVEMSGLSIAAARARGKSPEQWAKLSKQVNTARRNSAVLEDV